MELSKLICRSHQPSGRLTANSIAKGRIYASLNVPELASLIS
jgi:hypothetical protein